MTAKKTGEKQERTTNTKNTKNLELIEIGREHVVRFIQIQS